MPPLTVVVLLVAPSVPLPARITVPLLTVVPPVWLLGPVSVTLPLPALSAKLIWPGVDASALEKVPEKVVLAPAASIVLVEEESSVKSLE